MKLKLLFVSLFLSQILSAQIFTAPTAQEFEGVLESATAFADVDGDGDQDVIITGSQGFGDRISKLYINNGKGTFSEMPDTPFEEVLGGTVTFADVDGDNDQDVLITGQHSFGQEITKLYTNDGLGNFSEVWSTPFSNIIGRSVAFADMDGDNDPDLLISGRNGSNLPITVLYTNDGQGNFTELSGTPFDNLWGNLITFMDVDGDNDPDVLISGTTAAGPVEKITKLYLNDGQGNFSEMAGSSFEGVEVSSMTFADVDGDNDPDVLVTGWTGSGSPISKLYTNDGQGIFSEVMNTPFDAVSVSSIAFADVDGDNDSDVLITGWNTSVQGISKLYTNDGLGNFSEVTGTPFEGVGHSSIAFSDVDGDNDPDVLITGRNSLDVGITILYGNDGQGNFSELTETPFDDISNSSVAFADVDGDNDLDGLITGTNSAGYITTKLYKNDGQGNYAEVTGALFENVTGGDIAFMDVDGDNDPDVLITGTLASAQKSSKLYLNDGQGNFSEVSNTPFVDVTDSSIAFMDVDGDTDSDVLITGRSDGGVAISKLYTNDGNGNFSEVENTTFVGVKSGSIAFADVDGDNDPDVLITGRNDNDEGIAQLYNNDGLGNFSEAMGTPFDGLVNSSIAFADVDGDNDVDLLHMGYDGFDYTISKLYSNDGQGNFTEITETPFIGVSSGSIAFADVDGDNDPDVLITGFSHSTFQQFTKMYLNDGLGNFSELEDTPFLNVGSGSIAFADVNGDTDLDVLITGEDDYGQRFSRLYTNKSVLTSIEEVALELDLEFTLYPNPVASSHLKVNFNSTKNSDVILRLYNSNGQLLMQQKEFTNLGSQDILVNVSGLPAGNYFIQLEDGNRTGVGKFIAL